MPQSFDIWYVTSPEFTQIVVMWSKWPHPGCHRVYIDLKIETYKISWFETNRSRSLISPSGWTIFKFAPNRALWAKKAPPRVHQSMVSFL